MKKELEDKLMREFSFMENKNGNSVYCACGDGWYRLIWGLCYDITKLYAERNEDLDNIEVLQVKEKFGQLRFYVGWMIDGAHEIIEQYEELSGSICEICGDKGELRGDWIQALCDKHYKEETK